MTTYRYSIEIRRDNDASALLHTPLQPDWSAALESAHFAAVRRGALPPVTADGRGTIEPVWHSDLGPPYVAAFRAVLPGVAGGAGGGLEIPRAYVRSHAQSAASGLVERGVLQQGEIFQYVVSAFPAEPAPPLDHGAGAAFTVEAVPQPLPLHDGTLADFAGRGHASATAIDGDAPVFIPRAVLDEVQAHAERTADVESGGVLLGKLHRDTTVPDVFIEVTGFIAAPHTESTSTKLTFTGETWAAVRAALALRRRGETMIGWAHHHPDWCRLRHCPLERRRQCTLTNAFYSAEDILLMTAVFPRAFHVGLLLSESHAGYAASLFGWRQGMVAARGYHTIER